MDDEVCYSSVSFVKSEETKASEQHVGTQSEETVYSGVKKTNIQAGARPSQPADDAPQPGRPRCHCAVVALGVLTAVLLAALVASVTYFEIRNKDATTAKQHLDSKVVQLEQEKETLAIERDYLNSTLEAIFQFKDFEVDHFCPTLDSSTKERKCRGPCKKYWVEFQSSCYWFTPYTTGLTWQRSKDDCDWRRARLVIIDTLEKQAFINEHIKDAAYWIGLSKNGDKWHWVNGSELIGDGYWKHINDRGKCAQATNGSDPLKSWEARDCSLKLKYICEMDAAVWPG